MRLRILLSLLALIGLTAGLGHLNQQNEGQLTEVLRTPVTVGSYEFYPAQILFGLFITLILLTLARSVTRLLESRLRKKNTDDRGRNVEAIVTLSGYGLMCIAVLIGIGTAGIDLSSLAIIAGALSVGIGFGLQNIVSNFISGIILLIEQPIKSGDFIQVNGIEGYVLRVKIRGTEIVTFDYSTVIVPNSELISGTVTNWNLNNDFARITIAVGVAYGSDTRKVAALLEQCAAEHPLVIADAEKIVPAPVARFSDFGDSALNFRLSCYIRQADQRFQVGSELRFAIDDNFRENGIAIPFPQRDVHMIKSADNN